MIKGFYEIDEKLQERAEKLGHCAMFADKESLQEANEYALEVLNTLHGDARIAALTAYQVMFNTMVLGIVQGVFEEGR